MLNVPEWIAFLFFVKHLSHVWLLTFDLDIINEIGSLRPVYINFSTSNMFDFNIVSISPPFFYSIGSSCVKNVVQ